MTTVAPARRPSVGARRAGYAVAVAVNTMMLYLINAWPGWEAVPFLTQQTQQVVTLVNASVVVGLLANVAYLVYDPPWLRSLGDLVTTGVGLLALVRIWRVFPFAFADSSFDWALLVRVVLVVAIVGSVIGVVTQLAKLVRGAVLTR